MTYWSLALWFVIYKVRCLGSEPPDSRAKDTVAEAAYYFCFIGAVGLVSIVTFLS